jgi:hypothetical protein
MYSRESDLLLCACTWHTDGLHHDDATIGTCWDADRLDIERAGVIPNAKFMSTDSGREIGNHGSQALAGFCETAYRGPGKPSRSNKGIHRLVIQWVHRFLSTFSSTSSTVPTGIIVSFFFALSGMSGTSFSFISGMRMVLMPA